MAELTEDVKSKLVRQVEFYFSDSNLPKDSFLKGEVDKHPNGYVDLSLIISFARMRSLLNLSEHATAESVPDALVAAVADALRASGALEVSDDGFQVRRRAPLPDAGAAARAVDARSAYARPFPMAATIDAVTAFFEAQVGPVNCVRFRRHARSKDFKGSVMVEFDSDATAARALTLPLAYEGAPLRLEAKMLYMRRKMAERKAKKDGAQITLRMLEEADSDAEVGLVNEINAQAAERGTLAAARSGGGTKRAAEGAAGDGEAAAKQARGGGEGGGGNEAEAAAAAADDYPPGSLVRVEWAAAPAVGGDRGLSGFRVRGELGGRDAGVRFVEYEAGAASAIARYETAQAAEAAVAAFAARPEAERSVAGAAATLARVEGDEERAFFARAAAAAAAAKQQQQHQSGGGRGGGGRGGGRGRGRGGGGRGGRGRGGRSS